jgi:HK97 family phage portal protein
VVNVMRTPLTVLRTWAGALGLTWPGASWHGYGVTELGHLRTSTSPFDDGWQRHLRAVGVANIPIVSGIRHLHRSAFAQLRPAHRRTDPATGVVTEVQTSAASRVLLSPNSYETESEFAARLVDLWLSDGEVLVFALRNARFEVAAMHILPRTAWRLMVDPETREVFYAIADSGEPLLVAADISYAVPARDVMHLRWATPRHALIGESPFVAAGLAAGINVALQASQAVFFSEMRRPSGVLVTDQLLNRQQMQELRAAFDAQSHLLAQGGVPILSAGLKFQSMGINSADAQVIEALRMSNEEICRCCGVPPPLIGDMQNATRNNAETLIEHWLSLSLGGLIERYERACERLFGLDGRTDSIDMDVSALLRTDLAARMAALAQGVQGGVLTPNEARRVEGLSPVEGGDTCFLQRQMTPVDLLPKLATADIARNAAPGSTRLQ